jgi:hypothetical protein
VDFHIGFRTPAPADTDTDADRVETHLRALAHHHIRQVFAIGDGQGVGHGGQAVETPRFQLGRLRLVEEHGQRDFLTLLAGAQDGGHLVAGLDLVAERA